MLDQPDELLEREWLDAAPFDALFVMAAAALVNNGADMATAQIRSRGAGVCCLSRTTASLELSTITLLSSTARTRRAGSRRPAARWSRVPDVANDPVFDGTENQTVMLESGSSAVTSFPSVTPGGVAGVISAHYRIAGIHDQAAGVAIAGRLARRTAACGRSNNGDLSAEKVEQLLEALQTREPIAKAKGLLMASQRLSDAEAFATLVRVSPQQNVKLREVARWIVERHEARLGPGPDHVGGAAG
ncbi:MAG: ANTAR domain-containing protein [Actinomycetes bacterium]